VAYPQGDRGPLLSALTKDVRDIREEKIRREGIIYGREKQN